MIDSYLISHVNQWSRLLKIEKAGLSDFGGLERSIQTDTWFLFGNPFAKRWWRSMRDGFDSDFVRLLDAEIARLDDDLNARWLDDMRSPASSPTGS